MTNETNQVKVSVEIKLGLRVFELTLEQAKALQGRLNEIFPPPPPGQFNTGLFPPVLFPPCGLNPCGLN